MSRPDPVESSGHASSQCHGATGRTQAELATALAADLAEILVPVAEGRERQPISAGPPELPDLVQKLSRLAEATLGFGAHAMTGVDAVTAEEWRQLGGIYTAHGEVCARMASIVEARDDSNGR